MPAEWEPHAGCLMAWPSRSALWGSKLPAAKNDYASVAAAIAEFEPVIMVCSPGSAGDVRSLCGSGVQAVTKRQPYHRGSAEEVLQALLYFVAGHAWIAIGIQQALFCCDHRPFTVNEE